MKLFLILITIFPLISLSNDRCKILVDSSAINAFTEGSIFNSPEGFLENLADKGYKPTVVKLSVNNQNEPTLPLINLEGKLLHGFNLTMQGFYRSQQQGFNKNKIWSQAGLRINYDSKIIFDGEAHDIRNSGFMSSLTMGAYYYPDHISDVLDELQDCDQLYKEAVQISASNNQTITTDVKVGALAAIGSEATPTGLKTWENFTESSTLLQVSCIESTSVPVISAGPYDLFCNQHQTCVKVLNNTTKTIALKNHPEAMLTITCE